MIPDWLMPALGYIGALAAGYAAIRADLARLHEKAERAVLEASRAHERIDIYLNRRTT